MKTIDIKIPAKINNGKAASNDLFDIFVNNRDTIINGVTNAAKGGDVEGFFYFNVCPKLQVHGLVENEKVAGVQYRRYAITKAGVSFLADYDRQSFKLKQEQKKSEVEDAVSSVSSSQPKTARKKKVVTPNSSSPS